MIFDINNNEIKNLMGVKEENTKSDELINLDFSKKLYELCCNLYNNCGVTIVKSEDESLNLFMIPPNIVNDFYNGTIADYGHKIINLFNMIVAHLTNMEDLEPLDQESLNNTDNEQDRMKYIAHYMYYCVSKFENDNNATISDYLVFLLNLEDEVDMNNINSWCDAVIVKIDKYFKEVIDCGNYSIINDFNNWKAKNMRFNIQDEVHESPIMPDAEDMSGLQRMLNHAIQDGLVTDPQLSKEELEDLKDKVICTLIKER